MRLLFLFTAALSGCATVHPWERSMLADPVMAPELVPDTILAEQHFLVIREASGGGYGIAGGGCGCQ